MLITIVSGAPNAWLDVKEIQSSFCIGVDRGALTLLEHNLKPNVAIGDFDSVTESELLYIKQECSNIIQLSAEKNETDTEVALMYALEQKATNVHIYGALGGRFDHSIANIRLLLQFVKKGLTIKLIDHCHYLTVLAPGQHQIPKTNLPYISFFAVETPVKKLTLNGLKYPLTNYELTQEDIRCVSNEAIADTYSVSFESGYLLMIHSAD